jgi:hypothetical protein
VHQAVPGIAAAQARERAGAAMAAVIRAQEQLPNASPSAARRLLEEARETAMKAKSLAASDQYVECAAAAERALELVRQAIGMLKDGQADEVMR